jgi:hypothetical protein
VTESSAEYSEWDSATSFTSSVLNRLFSNDVTFIKVKPKQYATLGNGTVVKLPLHL